MKAVGKYVAISIFTILLSGLALAQEEITITYIRGGTEREVSVTLAERPREG
jgi:S1-C subfamily serine protease